MTRNTCETEMPCPRTGRRAALIEQIGDIERRADKITYETVQLLHATFITPFDRNDIHRLISSMDDILDLIQDSAESMHLFDIQTLPPEALRMAELLDSCCTKVKEAVGLLSSMLPTLLLSGFIFPISSMPPALRLISHIVPARYFISALREIVLKGVGPEVWWNDALALVAYGAVVLVLATVRTVRSL